MQRNGGGEEAVPPPGRGSAGEASLIATLRKSTGSIVLPLETWIQRNGGSALCRVIKEVKDREERWLSQQQRMTSECQANIEKLRVKTLSVEKLEATLAADPGYRDFSAEIRRLRENVRRADRKLEQKEAELRQAKEKGALEKSELQTALRDAQSGEHAAQLTRHAERASHTEVQLNDQIFHLRKQMQRLERKNMDLELQLKRVDAGPQSVDRGMPVVGRMPDTPGERANWSTPAAGSSRARTPTRKEPLRLEPTDADEPRGPTADEAELDAGGASPGAAARYRHMATAAQQKLKESQRATSTLEAELDHSRRELERCNRRNESMKLRIGTLTSQVDQSSRGMSRLQTVEAELEQKGGLVVEAEAAIKLLTSERQELLGEIQLLEERLMQRTREIQQLLDGREAYRTKMQGQIDALAAQNQELRMATSSSDDALQQSRRQTEAAIAQAHSDAQARSDEAIQVARVAAAARVQEADAARAEAEARVTAHSGLHAELQETQSAHQEQLAMALERSKSSEEQEAKLAAVLEAERAQRADMEKQLEQERAQRLGAEHTSQLQAQAAAQAVAEAQTAAQTRAAEEAEAARAQVLAQTEEQQARLAAAVEEERSKAEEQRAEMEKQLEEEREQRLAAEREKAELLSEEAHRSVSLASAVPNSAPPPSPAGGGEPGEVLEPATDEDAAAAPAPEPTRSTVEFLAAEASVAAESSPQASAEELDEPSATDEDPLPKGWESVKSRSTGQTYYHNLLTDDTTYDRPTLPAGSDAELAELIAEQEAESADEAEAPDGLEVAEAPAAEEVAEATTAVDAETGAEADAPQETGAAELLPKGWETIKSRSTGQTYFHNVLNGDTTYERPTEPAGSEQELAEFEAEAELEAEAEAEAEAESAAVEQPVSAPATEASSEVLDLTAAGGNDGGASKGKSGGKSSKRRFQIFSCGANKVGGSSRRRAATPMRRREPEPEPEPKSELEQEVPTEEEDLAEAGAEETPPQDDTLPPGWEAHTSRSTGETYFYNSITEDTTYDRPTEPADSADPNLATESYDDGFEELAELLEPDAQAAGSDEEAPLQDDTLPPGWEAHTSRSTGETYYHNTVTDETTYDRPTEPVAEARV